MAKQLKRTTRSASSGRTQDSSETHEGDGKFALRLNSQTAVQRDIRRQAERDARRAELVALYGDDADMFA